MICEVCKFDEDAAPIACMNTVGKVSGMLVCRLCEKKAALMELRERLGLGVKPPGVKTR